ncbi:MAG: hypothetical protein AAGL10_06315 [Pseudomonadota bacterium]
MATGLPISIQMVSEARVAAELSLEPTSLRPVISHALEEMSDQAAIFASNNVNAFMFRGFADADSEATNFSTSLSAKAVEKINEMEDRRRKEDDPGSDFGLIAEIAEANRRANAIFYGIAEEDLEATIDETLKNIDAVADKHGLDAQEKAELESWLIAYKTASPEERAEIREKIAEAYPSVAMGIADNAKVHAQKREAGAVSQQEAMEERVNEIEDDALYETTHEQIALSDGYSAVEASAYADTVLGIRDGGSTASNPFETGFSPASDFNLQATGSASAAETEHVETTPTVTGPALA